MFAPVKQTPALRMPLTHDYLAAIGGLMPDGQLFLQTQGHASHPYRSPDVLRFLRVRLAQNPRQVARIWDDLGWGADPSRLADQGLPGPWRGQAPAT